MNFKQKKDQVVNREGINTKKYVVVLTGIILVGALVVYSGFKVINFSKKVSQNWAEIKFAYEKPQFVKVVRVNYEQKESKLDQSFLQTQKSGEEKLLEEVASQLKASK